MLSICDGGFSLEKDLSNLEIYSLAASLELVGASGPDRTENLSRDGRLLGMGNAGWPKQWASHGKRSAATVRVMTIVENGSCLGDVRIFIDEFLTEVVTATVLDN
mmetsp:Transcript_11530/g.22312  ORF Transcript_11530/g.22312 Transcript_11530/m.22312 type:complete len:105 (-) Transcript_11530:254-568(-)